MLYGCWLCYYECGDKNEFQDYQKFDLPSFTSSTKVRATIFCVYIKLNPKSYSLVKYYKQTSYIFLFHLPIKVTIEVHIKDIPKV